MPQKLTPRLLLASLSAVALLSAQTVLAQDSFIIEGMTPSQPVAPPRAAPAPAPSFDRASAPLRSLELQRKPVAPLQPAPVPEANAGTSLSLAGSGASIVPALRLQLAPGEGPDDSALRYYASLNQTTRVQAETRRLQRLYPGWEVPTDLYNQAKADGEDEQAFWDLFATDQLDELRTAIDQRMRAEPGWQPSAELSQKLARKTVRNKVMGLYSAGKLQDLLDYIKNDGFNAEDTDIDVLWAVAETFAKSKQTQDAVQIYKSILTLNRESDVRIATIQKAMASMRMSDVEPLIAMGAVSADGKSEFAAIQTDITRARISSFLHDERVAEIPAPELKAFEDYARGASDPDQAGLVAWYYYKTKAFRDALDWFKLALERGGDAMIAHGLAHSLRELGMYRETEEVAYAWRQPLINNAILFIDILERDLTKEIPPYIEPERLFRYAQVTMDLASGEGAQGLGWYAYNSCQYDVAHEWFQRAAAWLPKEATVYGLALSARKIKQTREFVELVNRYDGLFPKVVSLLFPDRITPPSPCDLLTASPKQRQQMMSAYYASQNGYQQQQQLPNQSVRPSNGLRPSIGLPQQAYGGQQSYQQTYQAPQAPYSPWAMTQLPMPKLNPNEFPVVMNPENPLRFISTGKLLGRPMPIAASGLATLTQMAPEYYRGPLPVVARRVPGVGAMPYERYGFTLLAGWNGTTTASEPHNAETAPAGTLWTTDQAADAQSTGGVSRGSGADAMRQDPQAAAAALGQIPRVPPPNAAMGNAMQFMQMPAPMQQQQQGPGRQSRLMKYDRSPVSTIETTSVAMSSPNAASSPTAKTLSLLAFLKPKPLNDSDPLPSAPSRAPLAKATDDLGREAASHYNDQQYQAALDVLDRRAETMPEPIDLRLIRGWALIKLGRDGDARQVFGSLDSKQPLASSEFTTRGIIDEESP
jgi:tetratricopeptide (TPR) repeat protein